MSRRRDPLRLSSHWHVDCRIETDLPEDSFIGANFLSNIGFGALALVVAALFSWMVYHTISLRSQINVWQKRIDENRVEVREIQRMQKEYVAEASKIDRAYTAIRPALMVSEFLTALGRTLPAQVTVDIIEYNDNRISVRGNLRESPPVAAGIMQSYVKLLRKDAQFSQRFRLINLNNMPSKNEEIQNFELIFLLQPLPAL